MLSSLFWSPCQVHIQIPMSNIFDPFLLFSYMKSQGNDKLTPSVGRSRWYRSSLSSSCLFHSSTEFTRWVGKQALSDQVQFGTKATAQEYRKWHKIEKIVIHPDYWQVRPPSNLKNKKQFFFTGAEWSCPTPWCGLGNDWERGFYFIFNNPNNYMIFQSGKGRPVKSLSIY